MVPPCGTSFGGQVTHAFIQSANLWRDAARSLSFALGFAKWAVCEKARHSSVTALNTPTAGVHKICQRDHQNLKRVHPSLKGGKDPVWRTTSSLGSKSVDIHSSANYLAV